MKIDKDFAVKVEGRVFTANEISSVSFDIAWFRMNCISENGTKFTVEASLKDVEILSSSKDPAVETRAWTIWDGEEVKKETVQPWREYERCGDCGFYAPPKGIRADENEVVSPLGTTKKAVDEVVNQTVPKVQWKMNPYSRKFFDSIAKSIDKDNEVEKVIEEMLHEAVLEAEAADRRRLVKIIKGIMRSGG